MRPYTDEEWDTLPQFLLTEDKDWDPSVLEHTLSDDDQWFDAVSDLQDDPSTNLFDEFGNYCKRVTVQESDQFFDTEQEFRSETELVDECILLHNYLLLYEVNECTVVNKEPDYSSMLPYFGWLPVDVIKKTFEQTTQYA